MMTTSHSHELVLQSSFDEIERVDPFLRKVQESAGFSDDEFARIQLALSEAVTNAIVHGNKQDEAKKVFITSLFQEKKNEVVISVQDQGTGFDPSSLPDPLESDNLLKDSGRGVFLIKQYADSVQFSANGTKLQMHFRL